MVDEQQQIIANADSKGLILDYFAPMQGAFKQGLLGYIPRTDPGLVLKVIRNDPVVRALVVKLVDKVTESGWRIQPIDGNQKTRLTELEKKLKEVRFNRLLRKVVYHLIMYNNAFVEIRRKGGEFHDLNILEPEYMRINAEPNGDINFYFQLPGLQTDKLKQQESAPWVRKWEINEIVHFKLDDFTTNIWSEFNVEALYETILIKDYIRTWMQWFFKTNQLRPLIAAEDATKDSMVDFLAGLKGAENNIGKPIPIKGKVTVQALQDFAKQGATVLQVLDWCDKQIMMLLQVPGLAVGVTDTTGRSDGSELRSYLNTRVYTIHQVLEDDITYDLFPKINFGKNRFEFGVLDETVMTNVFDTVLKMRQAQFTPEAIEEFMEAEGVIFNADKVLLSQEDIMQMSNKQLGSGNEGMKGNKAMDSAQSRNRQQEDKISKGNTKVQNASTK